MTSLIVKVVTLGRVTAQGNIHFVRWYRAHPTNKVYYLNFLVALGYSAGHGGKYSCDLLPQMTGP